MAHASPHYRSTVVGINLQLDLQEADDLFQLIFSHVSGMNLPLRAIGTALEKAGVKPDDERVIDNIYSTKEALNTIGRSYMAANLS